MGDNVAIYEMRRESGNYQVFVQGDKLFRSEGDSLGSWKLYGGVNPETDYDVVEGGGHFEGGSQRPTEIYQVRKGDLCGQSISLKDIARGVRINDQLVVEPINSPRSKEKGISGVSTLSGRVSKIRTLEDVN